MTFIAAGRWNVNRFFSQKFQICIQLLLEVYPRRRLFYKYKYSGSYRLTSFSKYHWNSLTVTVDFSSGQTKLQSQNATFSFFFDPARFHFWKQFLAIMVSERYHQKMFRKKPSICFSCSNRFRYTWVKGHVFRQKCCIQLAISALTILITQKFYFTNLKNRQCSF